MFELKTNYKGNYTEGKTFCDIQTLLHAFLDLLVNIKKVTIIIYCIEVLPFVGFYQSMIVNFQTI